MIGAYRFLLTLAVPVFALLWSIRWLRGHETRGDLTERLGGGAPVGEAERVLWLHAASVGEVTAARPVAEALLARNAGLRIVVTCNTVTGRDAALRWANPRMAARLAPVDLRVCLGRFLRSVSPSAAIVVENELWPNRLLLLRSRGIPVAAIGARLSARSAGRWSRAPGLLRPLLSALVWVAPQDAASAARLRDLGMPPERLGAPVALKAAVALTPPTPEALVALGYDRAETVLAASTHAGEEEQVIAAFSRARERRPSLRLILAPRHPERGPEVARLIAAAGLAYATRSKGETPGTAPVYLADTMGEMALWYAASGIVFVGGSLVEKGGHTPYEPAQFGCAILHGPHVENAAAAFTRLGEATLAVSDADALARALVDLDGPEQEALGKQARTALAAQDLEPLIEALEDRLNLTG